MKSECDSHLLTNYLVSYSLTISYHAICVDTHINVVLHSFPSGEQKRLMNDVHANKYSYLSLAR